MCITPVYIKQDAKLKGKYTPLPCGKCVDCVKKRVKMWAFRLKQEMKISDTAVFLTLTFNDEHAHLMPLKDTVNTKTGEILQMPSLQRRPLTLFHKRLRKASEPYLKASGKTIKYYAVGEYGGQTERPHYHGIYFNIPEPLFKRGNHVLLDPLLQTWQYGHIFLGDVTPASIGYVCGYVNKKPFETWKHEDTQFSVMSKGLGRSYMTSEMVNYHKQKKQPYIVDNGGQKLPLPRYYKDKMLTDEEKLSMRQMTLQFIENKSRSITLTDHQLAESLKAKHNNALKKELTRKKI